MIPRAIVNGIRSFGANSAYELLFFGYGMGQCQRRTESDHRVASCNFVTGCLNNDVTGRPGNEAFHVNLSTKSAVQSAANGGRDPRMRCLRAMFGGRSDIRRDEAQIAYQPLRSLAAPDPYATM